MVCVAELPGQLFAADALITQIDQRSLQHFVLSIPMKFMMASFKYAIHLRQGSSNVFDQKHPPGIVAPYAGIYRCVVCGDEIGIAQGLRCRRKTIISISPGVAGSGGSCSCKRTSH